MSRRSRGSSWSKYAPTSSIDTPVESSDDWRRVIWTVESYASPERLVLDDPTSSYRTTDKDSYTVGVGSPFVHVAQIEELLKNAFEPLKNWEKSVIPSPAFTVPEPKPIFMPPMRSRPQPKAGEEPKKPRAEDYHLGSTGLFDMLFGAQRRADEEKRFRSDLAKWEREFSAWERQHKADEAAIALYQELAGQYEEVRQKAHAKFEAAQKSWQDNRDEWIRQCTEVQKKVEKLRHGYQEGTPSEIERFFDLVMRLSPYPKAFPRHHAVKFDAKEGVLIVEMQLPNLMEIFVAKDGPRGSLKAASERERKSVHESSAYRVVVRTLFELATSDEFGKVNLIVVNGWIDYIDPVDGHSKQAYVISVSADPVKLRRLNIADLDAREAIRSFSGRLSPNLSAMVSVPPILQLNREDRRIINSDFNLSEVASSTNLAAMPWEDFEYLIRELFARQFSGEGAEVRVTRASRDGGVDAIAWDPDPVRGGKFVIQAKRYTNTVGVSAVRDLYGTLINEGANRGILVTTSGYGPDAIEFSKDKAISLIDGPMLLGLLEAHGYSFRIDLAEARSLAKSS